MLIQLLYNLFKSKKAGLNDSWLYILLALIVLAAAFMMIRYFGLAGDDKISFIGGKLGDELTSRG